MKTSPILFVTLLLLISFASVNAVLFTPALPSISHYFNISDSRAQLTLTWFLIGYALGQLLYGPLANRFGRKNAIYAGISLQIISSAMCILSSSVHSYSLLIFGRFLLALGSGVGLKMTFTLVNELFDSKTASQKISYLMLAFAITPGLAIYCGGFLTAHFGWTSCFYSGALYGFLLLLLCTQLPETCKQVDKDALKMSYLWNSYLIQFKNRKLVNGGLLMGICTAFIYAFAATAPFIAIDLYKMDSESYGLASVLPPIGIFLGSLISAFSVKKTEPMNLVKYGIIISSLGVVGMLILNLFKLPVLTLLFFPAILIYFGLSFILPNASIIAMNHTQDKAHGSAVMNFINIGFATTSLLILGAFSATPMLLPIVYFCLCLVMCIIYQDLKNN